MVCGRSVLCRPGQACNLSHSQVQGYAVPIVGTRIIAALLVLLGSMQLCVAQAPAVSSVDPILRLTATPTPGLIRVELHNPGAEDLVLNLGIELANGAKQYPNAVAYTLTTPDGQILHLEPWEPAFIAGRVDPLIVPLPAGAAFSFLVNLEAYVAPKQNIWKLQLARGRYTLRAKYTGKAVPQAEANLDVKGIALMQYWTGTVTAAPIVFTVPSEQARTPHR